MKFLKVTSSKYVGTHGYGLITMRDGSFSIVLNNHVTKWGTGFQTVKAAENFINSHDYVSARVNRLPLNEDDVKFIADFYGFSKLDKYEYQKQMKDGENLMMWVDPKTKDITFQFGTKSSLSMTLPDALDWLDKRIYSSEIFNKVVFRGTEFANQSIYASLRPQDLMRVKSSNVWAIGVEVDNKNRKLGTVYVQFKGKNGGPDAVYRYYSVPITLYRKFVTTSSKGAFVWKYLRNNFQYSKLTGDKKGKLKNAIN